jgi:transcriptional regulator with XRE-family HTH domain
MKTHQRIHHLRKTLLRITQAEFAEKISMSRSNFAAIEQGKISLTDRVAKDICREFSVRLEWLEDGMEPIFLADADKDADSIAGIYGQLSENNRNFARGYMERLLEEQQSTVSRFTDQDLTEEEIEYLKRILDRRKGGKNG